VDQQEIQIINIYIKIIPIVNIDNNKKFIEKNIISMIKDNIFQKVKIFSLPKFYFILFFFLLIGIPVVFEEELEEKLEQTHTPLVMRIEKAPFYNELERGTL
jgi:hypothetical protein